MFCISRSRKQAGYSYFVFNFEVDGYGNFGLRGIEADHDATSNNIRCTGSVENSTIDTEEPIPHQSSL